MSTATIAAGPGAVRPLSAIKADMANRLAQQPQSVYADLKSAIVWLPKKIQGAVLRAARWLHVPQFYTFVRTQFSRFIGLVGKGAFIVEMLTSHWGQKTIVAGVKVAAKVTEVAAKIAWKILSSPFRLFGPTRRAVEKVETKVASANKKLTPNSGETFGPVQIVRDGLAHAVSADRSHMKVARTTALAVMAVRITRRFTPPGFLRVAAYILDGLLISKSYDDALKGTWLGKKLAHEQVQIEADIVRQEETVIAEATHLNREAAEKTAANLRAQAAAVEEEGIKAAEQLTADLVAETAENAEELRQQASALEASAERLAAAEAAVTATEATPETSTVLVEDKPKPGGPFVPPMGGRTPSNGPQHGPASKKQRDRR